MPDPDYSITEWADKYRVLPRESSKEHGQYRSSRTPFFIQIMEALSPSSGILHVCLMKPTQIGGTEIGNNWIFYVIDVAPGPMLMMLPTVELAKDHSKLKLAPSIQVTPKIKNKIKDSRIKDSNNTIQSKQFPGGALYLSGSNSGAHFRSKSIRYLFLDDVDGFEADINQEGDAIDLAIRRTDTYFEQKKIFVCSTPTIKGQSRIEVSFDESDQRYYFVPCPFCGNFQRLTWPQIRFTRDENGEVLAVWYECQHCGQGIDESHKTKMLDAGTWVPTYPYRKKRGYHLSSLYSPLGWVSWFQIVEEFISAKKDPTKLKVWTNTRLAETWELVASQPPDREMLRDRCEDYQMGTIPGEGPKILTAGVDVQSSPGRLAVQIIAWGPSEESWVIHWSEIYGNPGQPEIWGQLDMILNKTYYDDAGQGHNVVSAAVDTGGHHTQDVYKYCRARLPRAMAIKGYNVSGKPIIGKPSIQDVMWDGKKIPGGVQLWMIGTDSAKEQIYNRLKQTAQGPGYIHFYKDLPDDYFEQLTAEKQMEVRDKRGFSKVQWVKVKTRNEGLDTFVYALAAANRSGIMYLEGSKGRPKQRVKKTGPSKNHSEKQRAGFNRPSWLDKR